jgi:hypothetical protein
MRSITLGLILVTAMLGCGGNKGGGAAACDCRFEGTGDSRVLVMSWDCLCPQGECLSSGPTCDSGQTATAYPGCGLTVTERMTIGGPWIHVYDQSGALVGMQMGTDAGSFACPSDPSLTAYTKRGGRFPEPSCSGVACVCAEGVPMCPGQDGGGPG